MVATSHLSTYLNDHLAGSVSALEMLGRLREAYHDRFDTSVFERIESGIQEDRSLLERLMQRLGVSHSPVRQAAGWLAERAARLKLAIDDPSDGALRAFEMIELLSLGIEGRMSLWRSLSAIAADEQSLNDVDFEALIRRAREERERLEPLHAAAAREALVARPAQGAHASD